MSILIQNGTLIRPDGTQQADLRITDGLISQIGSHLPVEDSQVIDASGKLVFPGFIDTHTHLEMNKGLPTETADDWASGTTAALAGGTTSILDFAEAPKGGSLLEAAQLWHSRAKGRASCHYGFHMTLKEWNDTVKEELKTLMAEGITSFKVYLAYDNLRISDGTAYALVKAVGELGGTVGCHCENGDLVTAGIRKQLALGHTEPFAHPLSRPPVVEAEAVSRWLAVGEMAGYPVNIVHLSTQQGLEQVRLARQRGQKCYVETCPQYLLLDDSYYSKPDFEGAKYVFSPPARSLDDQAALWEGLKAGEIDTMGTDHCSFHFKGVKELGRGDFSKIPNGLPGIEHRPSLMYSYGVATGKITSVDMANILATQPAKLFGMYPQKGVLQVGSDGDIAIIDPEYTGSIQAEHQYQAVDYTPYEGFGLTGRVDTVLLSGEVVVEEGKVLSTGCGQFLHRKPGEFWR